MAEAFRRVGKKYIIDKEQYMCLRKCLESKMIEDKHGKSKICNIYFDTDNYELISHSIEKTIYKDKVRVRSYNIPQKEDNVYLEIKRKYDSVVSKRRIKLKLKDVCDYLEDREIEIKDMQVKKELDYYIEYFKLSPKMYVSYDREALYGVDDENFRITFDNNITARNYDLDLDKGSYGFNIFEEDKYIMEVKTLGAMPIGFVKLLAENNIFPNGYSKYGNAYTKLILNKI